MNLCEERRIDGDQTTFRYNPTKDDRRFWNLYVSLTYVKKNGLKGIEKRSGIIQQKNVEDFGIYLSHKLMQE